MNIIPHTHQIFHTQSIPEIITQIQNTTLLDDLVYTSQFALDSTHKTMACQLIRAIAEASGAYPASIYDIYMAYGKNQITGFTVPAINMRTLTYDTARRVFRLMKKYAVGTIIFEIARSEMQYTDQPPEVFAAAIFGAAIREGYRGPLFLQGDHFQLSQRQFLQNAEREKEHIALLCQSAIQAGFFNIDIDASTLVDLTHANLLQQQENNARISAYMTQIIRKAEPPGITISIGGEIGHIGGVNSTVDDLHVYMQLYQQYLPKGYTGMSKISIQTGTSHGGTPLADCSIAPVHIDFDLIGKLGDIVRTSYAMGGVVQHGASTLPLDTFDIFPRYRTLEIHLATQFQTILFDTMPTHIREEIYLWIKQNLAAEFHEKNTEMQNIYKTRKKATGVFKRRMWDMSIEEKAPMLDAFEKQVSILLAKLRAHNTYHLALQHTPYHPTTQLTRQQGMNLDIQADVSDLSD